MSGHERSGWRDAWPSAWHRQMGSDFPLCDVDALLFDNLRPVAMFDWKAPAAKWHPTDPSLIAQRNLANGYSSHQHPDGLPFYVVTYWQQSLTLRPHAMNTAAVRALDNPEGTFAGLPFRTLTEGQFAYFEGSLRGLTIAQAARGVDCLRASDLPQPLTSTRPESVRFDYSREAHVQRSPNSWQRSQDSPPQDYRKIH